VCPLLVKIRAKASPIMGFLACPMWMGCSGLTLVCSTITFAGFSVLMKPYVESNCLIDLRVKAENLGKLTWKLT